MTSASENSEVLIRSFPNLESRKHHTTCPAKLRKIKKKFKYAGLFYVKFNFCGDIIIMTKIWSLVTIKGHSQQHS